MTEADFKAMGAVILAAIALGARQTAFKLLSALFSPKVIEWAVLRALRWLAGRTSSGVDNELVELVAEAMQGNEPGPADDLGTGDQHQTAQASLCPACGQPMPPSA